MLRDARGERAATTSREALGLYERALTQFQSHVGDPIATIDAAIAVDPGFVAAHAFRATVLMLGSERRSVGQARESVETAEALAARTTPREVGLTTAARRWLSGDWQGACRVWEDVLVDHPRDAFALQAAHLTDFFLGDAVSLRDRVARVLPQWSEGVPGYSYLLGMHAFGLEECNQYGLAEQVGRRALDIEPRDAWAVHAVTHVMEMENRFDEGIEWLRGREPDWAPDNGFAFHNAWHLALFHVEKHDHDAALAVYDRFLHPADTDPSLQLLDASALLWRMRLYDVDVGDRWTPLAGAWASKAGSENGYYAFNDAHAMMAFLAANRDEDARRLLVDLIGAAAGSAGTNAAMTRLVGLPLCHGLRAFHAGRYDEAVELLEPIRPAAHRLGGSHAQRDLIAQTLVEAALRAGRHRLATHLVNERIAHKPHSPLAWSFRAKVLAASGATDAATAAANRASRYARETHAAAA